MMKSFKQFNEAKEKEVFFTFGRFNPPTTGHQKLMDKIAKVAKGKDYKIYASNSVDPKKNPLPYKEKVRFMRKMFPKHARSIMMSPKIKTAINIAVELYNMGYNKLTMVVGGDRIKEFDSLLKRYNGVKARHGYYDFTSIDVVSAGERDPDATDVTGMSASKMRAAAADNDFKAFQGGLPKGYSGGVQLFNALRKAMGLKEITDFREHVQLDKISDIREQYARGEIFNIGDRVYNKDNKIVTISERKPNYIVSAIGKKYWIQDLSEEKNPRIPRKKGQPANSKKHSDLYTDENPKGTIKGLGFKDVETAEASIKKIENSGKTHAHKIQAAIAMEQRARVMKKTGPAAVYRKYINKMKKKTKEKNESVVENVSNTLLMEKLITFANKAYPKNGHVLILAGGAGSGKGFVLDNLIGLEGKKFDVDELKRLTLRAPKIIDRIKRDIGVDMMSFELTKPADVGKLHDIVADELNLPNKKLAAFFASVINKRPEEKPNIIFDVTLKDLRKLDNITRLAQGAMYDKKKIHIVWVVNDVEVAKTQNTDPSRGRVVPVEILVNTHRGASQTMLDIVNMGSRLKKYMDGDIVFAFNKIGVDSDLAKSGKGGKYLKDANYFYVKRSGKPTMKQKDIQKDILKKISSYVPAGQDWVVKENVSFKDYKPFGLLGTLELKKKYEKIVPHDETDIDEADGCWDGYKKVGMKKKGKKMVPNCVPEENIEEGEKKKSETWEAGFKRRVVKTTKPEHKEKGYNWRIKGKERPEVTIKLYKSKPDFAEFKKQMKRVAGHEFGG